MHKIGKFVSTLLGQCRSQAAVLSSPWTHTSALRKLQWHWSSWPVPEGVGWFKITSRQTMTTIHKHSLTGHIPKNPRPSRNPLCCSHQRGRIVLDIQHCWRGNRCNLNCGMFLQALLKWFWAPSFWLPHYSVNSVVIHSVNSSCHFSHLVTIELRSFCATELQACCYVAKLCLDLGHSHLYISIFCHLKVYSTLCHIFGWSDCASVQSGKSAEVDTWPLLRT